ncbi:MAG: hypothetical protein PQJ59_04635, partial [Spirochaetales bacterium]|nr:hypothetical protein [Spirochaetales bacterium]
MSLRLGMSVGTEFRIQKPESRSVDLPSNRYLRIDKLVKSLNLSIFVIPAKTGIHHFQWVVDSRRGNDMSGDFVRNHQGL